MKRWKVAVSVEVFASSKDEAKEKGLEHLYEMMEEDKSSFRPISLDAEVEESR